MTESEIPKEYNANEVEKKWMEKWNLSMYHFNWGEDTRPSISLIPHLHILQAISISETRLTGVISTS